jgi:non-heme chloroperoxidase
MSPTVIPLPRTTPVDEDLVDQARPGHGVPSQDPDPAAQQPLTPSEAEREPKSSLTGGGMVVGAATGAALGVAMGGPAGVVVGATLGAMAGALGGAAAGVAAEAASPSEPDLRPVHLHVDDSGGGRPVVLIHGWPLSAQAWAPQVAALRADGYRVVAYDRRGFGRSDKHASGYGYDTLADDLHRVMTDRDLRDVTLVGFSMGGGEVARYVARFGESRLHSVVFAAAVTPCLMKAADNPEGPLTADQAQEKKAALTSDRHAFFDAFTQSFFSADGTLLVTATQRADAIALCEQSAPHAALACMDAFSTTDFRQDLCSVTVPTLVIHGEADAIVPIAASGERTHRAVAHSQMVRIPGAPHGLNVTHAPAFNEALLSFLRASPTLAHPDPFAQRLS